ncbi:MAG: S8 family serine peptidase [Thiolinea sp.]
MRRPLRPWRWPSRTWQAGSLTNDRLLQDDADATWGIHAVRADTSPYTGRGARVAILDTGIDAGHERFAVELIRRNFSGEAAEDVNGHGTHCAGNRVRSAAKRQAAHRRSARR